MIKFFFIQYKSLALILIKSNWFYLRWERKLTVKALSRFHKLKYNYVLIDFQQSLFEINLNQMTINLLVFRSVWLARRSRR